MAAPTTGRQNSRFSSLNVFKFSSSSKPPPLPPKDIAYLPNPSLPSLNHSLSPDSFSSQPVTPLSAQYANLVRSPSPSPSYAPSRMTMSPASSSSSALSPESGGFRRGLQKLSSFGRRPRTPKTPEIDLLEPQEPVEDPSISLPWNFQHNLHVDESCNSLPPTWAARLNEMGLSEEEIATINSRRAAARSQSARSIYSMNTDRNTILATGVPPSLYRGLSEASASQTSLSSGAPSHYRNPSIAASSSEVALSSVYDSAPVRPARALPPPSRPVPVPSELSASTASSKDSVPKTPPRRAYHVANDSLTGMSPPPAYTSTRRDAPLNNVDEGLVPPPMPEKPPIDVSPPPPSLPTAVATTSSTLLASPPRLSLQKDGLGDLSSWTESLFSIIPPADSPPRPTPSTSTNPTNRSPASIRMRSKSHSRSSSSSHRNLPPQKPVPLHDLPQRAVLSPVAANDTPPSTANTTNPLWQEVMDLVRPSATRESTARPRSLTKPKSTPALTSASSSSSSSDVPPTPEPLLPVSDNLAPPPTQTRANGDNGSDDEDGMLVVRPREKENRDSDLSTMTVVPATIVRGAVARSARGNIVASPAKSNDEPDVYRQSAFLVTTPTTDATDDASRRSHSPVSCESRSSSSSISTTAFGSGSTSGSAYMKVSPAPSPRVATFAAAQRERPARMSKGKGELPKLNLEIDLDLDLDLDVLRRPSILIDDIIATGALSEATQLSSTSSARISPISPAPRYPGWVLEVVAPLSEFIDESLDPHVLFGDLRKVGEGESGSVYAARVLVPNKNDSTHKGYVAIKNVPLLPNGSPKLSDLQRELKLMRDVRHSNVLSMEQVFVDVVEDALWIKMELMERSLADVVMLAEEGIVVQEKPIAQFASDVLHALSYLQLLGIAHRDLCSDNLLVSPRGVVKIADFSSAVQVPRDEPTCSDPAGVIYWQPPEMRLGSYNALKVDVWSLGATVWEMAEAEPPFSNITDPRQMADRWPPLNQPEIYSRSFHDFLHLCSEPSSSRPDPDELLKTPFIQSASGRPGILKLLEDCRSVEERLARRQSGDSHGTVSLS